MTRRIRSLVAQVQAEHKDDPNWRVRESEGWILTLFAVGVVMAMLCWSAGS